MNNQVISDQEYLNLLLTLPAVRFPRRSPNSKNISMNIVNLHKNFDVFIMSTNDYTVTPLTNNDQTTLLGQWWPDSKSLIVSQDKDRNERSTLYRVFLDSPSVLNPLTEIDPDYYIRGANLSPDGKFLYYFANYNFELKKETDISHLFKQEISSGTIQKLTSPEKPTYHSLNLNEKGSHLIYNRSDINPSGEQWWLIDKEGKIDKEILNFGDEGKIGCIWHPDSENIAFVTDSFEGIRLNKHATGLYNINTQEINWITNPKDENRIDYDYILAPKYAPDKLILLETNKAKYLSHFYDIKNKIAIPIQRIPGTLLPLQKLETGKWIGVHYSSKQPGSIVTFDEKDIEKLELSKINYRFDNFKYSNLKKEDLFQAEELEWKSYDGKMIHGWLYRAKNNSKKAIVYVHGGPTGNSTNAINVEIQYYLKQGFNVLDPNYRGSTGYSIDFQESIKKNGWGSNEQEDIAAGVEKLIELDLVSKNDSGIAKVGITGTSYGGYSAWCAITKFPDLFAASAPVCGMTDLVIDYETTRPDLRTLSEEHMGGSPDEVPERYRQGSPINYIQNIKGKVLIVQGLRDPNVTPSNVKSVEKALKKHNIEYELLAFDNEGHGIVKRENKVTKIIRISEFFNKTIN